MGDLAKYQTIQLIGFVAGIASILGLVALWDSPWRPFVMGAVVFGAAALVIAEHQKDRVTVLFSGVQRYYRSFPVEKNAAVFDSIETSYRYFGISFGSIREQFVSWYGSRRRGSPTIELLLMDPEADEILSFQARYELNLFADPLPPAQQMEIDRIVERSKRSIYATLSDLATLPAGGEIKVRFHRDRARRWTHEINSSTIYLGLLRRGNRGLESPVLRLKSRDTWTLFNHHHDGWEGLWQVSKEVDVSTYKVGANAGA